MGIKGLASFLRKRAPNGFTNLQDLSSLHGLRFAIDVPIFAYKFAYHRKDPQNTNELVESFLNHAEYLKNQGIVPIYVFDGVQVDAKLSFEAKRRNISREENKKKQVSTIAKLQKKRSDLINMEGFVTSFSTIAKLDEQIETVQKRVVQLRKEDYLHLQEAFKQLEIQYCLAPGDAERECAKLCLSGQADVVVTDDYDALPCGAQLVLRNLSSTKKQLEVVNLEVVLTSLNLTYQTFVDFCILCGSDFTQHLHKIGPVTAYKAMVTYGCLEKYFELDTNGKKLSSADNFYQNFNYNRARQLFSK